MRKVGKFLLDYIFIIIMTCIIVCNLFIVGVMKTSGTSMEPTIHAGSYILVKKFDLQLERNQVVVAWHDTYRIVKRIVGLPGETVEIKEDGTILVNGEEYDNEFQGAWFDGAMYVGKEITLGEDEYFLMGDNRPNSSDSRMNGPVSRDKITGTVQYVFDGEGDPYVENEEN